MRDAAGGGTKAFRQDPRRGRRTSRSVASRQSTAKSATPTATAASAATTQRSRLEENERRRAPPALAASAIPRKQSCASASRMRSKTIEASRAGKGRPRSRARIAGPDDSPARAGSTVLAAKPIGGRAERRDRTGPGRAAAGSRPSAAPAATKVEQRDDDARGEPAGEAGAIRAADVGKRDAREEVGEETERRGRSRRPPGSGGTGAGPSST